MADIYGSVLSLYTPACVTFCRTVVFTWYYINLVRFPHVADSNVGVDHVTFGVFTLVLCKIT